MKEIKLPSQYMRFWNLHRKLRTLHNDDIKGFCKILTEFDEKHPGELRIISELPASMPKVAPKIRLASKEQFHQYARKVSQRIFRQKLLNELEMESAVKEGRHLTLVEDKDNAE